LNRFEKLQDLLIELLSYYNRIDIIEYVIKLIVSLDITPDFLNKVLQLLYDNYKEDFPSLVDDISKDRKLGRYAYKLEDFLESINNK
jgi:hypothetical protein